MPTFQIWFVVSWQRTLTTCHWLCNCNNSSVFCVMDYCPTSTVFRNPASLQTFSNWSGSEKFSTRSFSYAIDFLCKNSDRGCGCHYQQVCWRVTWVGLLCHNKSPCASLVDTVLFTQVWDFSVDSKKIDRILFARKIHSYIHRQKCMNNFQPPVLLSVPLHNELLARKTGCPFSPNLNINPATRSNYPPGLHLWRTPFLIQIWRVTNVLLEISWRIKTQMWNQQYRCHWTST